MSPVIDFTGVKTTFEPIPDGEYQATVTDWEIKETKEGKNEGASYIAVEFTISEGEFENRKQWRNYSMLRQSLWALKKMLVNCGLSEDDLDGELDLDDLMPEVVGAPCTLKIGHHTYDGEVRNDVKDVLPAA